MWDNLKFVYEAANETLLYHSSKRDLTVPLHQTRPYCTMAANETLLYHGSKRDLTVPWQQTRPYCTILYLEIL